MLKIVLLCLFSLLASQAWAQLVLNQEPPLVELHGELGGRLDGSAWSSREISGVVSTLMYVDPDAKGWNRSVEQALADAHFPQGEFKSIAVINMAATWLPNGVIGALLQKKQERFKDTLYLKDFRKEIIRKWGVRDDSYNVLAFDRRGRLIFYRAGKLSATEVDGLVTLIRSKLRPRP